MWRLAIGPIAYYSISMMTKNTLPKEEVQKFEHALAYNFSNLSLLENCLPYFSCADDTDDGRLLGERQEFLGGAVVKLGTSSELYSRFPATTEGGMSQMRSEMVSIGSLSQRARETGLDKLISLAGGEKASGKSHGDAVLSDAFKAVMAAVYEDGGYADAQKVLKHVFASVWPKEPDEAQKASDYKVKLHAFSTQTYNGQPPVYTRMNATGPGHAQPPFVVNVCLPDGMEYEAEGPSWKRAGQNAAALALQAPRSTTNLPKSSVQQIERALGYHFKNISLAERALTRSSFARDHKGSIIHNERQEFLGDAVIDLCVSWELYRRVPQAGKGELVHLLSQLVSTAALAQRARETGLDQLARLGKDDEVNGGINSDRVLSNVFEAMMAAVFEDGGIIAAQNVTAFVFKSVLPQDPGAKADPVCTTKLQQGTEPVVAVEAPCNEMIVPGKGKTWSVTVNVHLPDTGSFEAGGTGRSRESQALPAVPQKVALSREELQGLELALGYHFTDVSLLETALTHSSFANEAGGGLVHNERQEFLGDAVVELCVSWELFSRFPSTREGDMTRLRSDLVNTVSLAQRARETGIDKLIRLGRGEEGQGGRSRDTVLSDVFEAVMAAVYQDGGYAAAQKVIARVFKDIWPDDPNEGKKGLDYKTKLQEYTQHAFGGERPVYNELAASGPAHARTFTVSVRLPNGSCFEAEGSSWKKAEQSAAAQALQDAGISIGR